MFGIGKPKKKKGTLQSLVDKQQKEHLKKFKAEQRARAKKEALQKRTAQLSSEAELYRAELKKRKAKQRLRKAKPMAFGFVPLPKKKAQNKKLSRKSRIRLI